MELRKRGSLFLGRGAVDLSHFKVTAVEMSMMNHVRCELFNALW